MKLPDHFHLTYCSNIHPGESWQEVRRNLGRFLPKIRARLSPHGAFGVGLRLSAQAAEQLAEPETMEEFQAFLAAEQCYVFTLNGFPYGVFHHARVKEEVYLPDWRDEERLEYTNRLAGIMAQLLPDEPGLEGSVSTVPGAFKAEVKGEEDVLLMARNILRHAAELHAIRQRTGKMVTLALEPEPCCYIETVAEAVDFFRDYLLAPALLAELAENLEVTPERAETIVREHIGLCYDACHMAVEFEDTGQALAALAKAGIKICKFQISSALKLSFRRGDGRPAKTLSDFAESTYLHQVVERTGAGLVRYADLPEGLAAEALADGKQGGKDGEAVEWRVHFHVPIFLEEMRNFQTTQSELIELLQRLKVNAPCPYLEVETYTWDVLPPEYKSADLADDIVRELEWVKQMLAG